jgi:transaldolase
MADKYLGPLHESVSTTATDLWNDSCSVYELEDSLRYGAVGATTNPVIVYEVLQKEISLWGGRIQEIIAELPQATEDDIAWKLIEDMAVRASKLLLPIFEREKGKKGRLSIQTNAKYFRNAALMVEQARKFDALAPNMQVKIPATAAGIRAIEEATFTGVSINATVSFTLPQAIAVAEAVERGFMRRENAGLPLDNIAPVCTLMIGRLDDWLKVVAEKGNITVDPGCLDWAGIAVLKKAYCIYKQRGYRTRLLTAAFRNHWHWSETIGGDIAMTIPYKWQLRYNASDITVENRMDNPVDDRIICTLTEKFVDFRHAYEEDGLALQEFDTFGATVRTLRSFMSGYDNLLCVVRDRLLLDPDK